MKRYLSLPLALATAIAFAACEESLDPTGGLTVDFSLSAGHIHALETNVTYIVRVTDEQARVVGDFETLRVEQSLVGSNQWRPLTLPYQGNGFYSATHQFINPGTYSMRVVGTRPGQGAEAVIKDVATTFDAVRSHWDAGGYRVEFDISPGFPDELTSGKAYTLQFFIMQPAQPRPPVTGLTGVTIRCTEANGTVQDHPATEVAPGVYQASHTFSAKGAVTARVSFPGTTGAATVDTPLTLQ